MDEVEDEQYHVCLCNIFDLVVARKIYSIIYPCNVNDNKQLLEKCQQVLDIIALEDVYSIWLEYIATTNVSENAFLKFSLTIRSDDWWYNYVMNEEKRSQLHQIISKLSSLERVFSEI